MKTQVLARWYHHDGWIAFAYHGASSFCTVRDSSEARVLQALAREVQDIIVAQGRAWLEQCNRPTPTLMNCPEGAIKLPIDLWVCKLTKEKCPIQAQIDLDDRHFFLAHCQAPTERKEQIFECLANGAYQGFHHISGRYLCPGCERDGLRMNFRHHYPWELTLLEAYYPFDFKQDWRRVRPKLKDKHFGLTLVSTALCARHCKELAEQLDPVLAAQLTTIEFDFFR